MKRLNQKALAALSIFFITSQSIPVFAVTRTAIPSRKLDSPTAIQLTGTASAGGEHWLFEILINRFGSYFRKEWSGREGSMVKGDRTGFSRLVLISGGFRGEHRRIWAPIDIVTSTGYGHSRGANNHEVGLRLLQDGHIIGYRPGAASMEWTNGRVSERFQQPFRFGAILIPSRMIWNDTTRSTGQTTTIYSVQHTKTLSSSEGAIFHSLLREYFPRAATTGPKAAGPSMRAQNSALPGLRGNGMTSRMFFIPVR